MPDLWLEEHRRAAARLRAEVEALPLPRARTIRPLDRERSDVMRALVHGYLDRQEAALQAAEGAPPGLALDDSRRKLVTATVQAERSWQFSRALLGQRRDLHVGEMLARADACARDGYETFLLRLGKTRERLAPPLVWLEAMSSPATFPRGWLAKSAGLITAATELPLPILLLPPDHLPSVWQWGPLQHEVGHVLDRDLGLTEELTKSLDREFGIHGVEWRAWLGEVVADVFGVLLGGAGFTWTLALLFSRQALWDTWDGLNDPHPPALLRLRILCKLLELRGSALPGFGPVELAALAPKTSRLEFRVQAHDKEVEPIVRGILERPLAALGGKALEELSPNPGEDAKAIERLLLRLRGEGGDTRNVPRRLVAGAVQLRALQLESPSADALAELQSKAVEILDEQPRMAGETSPERWKFLREQVAVMEPPILTRARLKVPPVELLLAYKDVSFVGATHDQLAGTFRGALEAQPDRKWTRLEVFFLSEPRMAALAHDGRTAADLQQAREAALGELCALLPTISEAGAVLEYDDPFFFASYWDVAEPGGRIHVSPAIWGEDLRVCPAIDHVWEGGAQSPAYAAYARGLAGLRSRAKVLAEWGRPEAIAS